MNYGTHLGVGGKWGHAKYMADLLFIILLREIFENYYCVMGLIHKEKNRRPETWMVLQIKILLPILTT